MSHISCFGEESADGIPYTHALEMLHVLPWNQILPKWSFSLNVVSVTSVFRQHGVRKRSVLAILGPQKSINFTIPAKYR